MLLHLPIAILATLSPIPVSSTVPGFDMARECRFEAGSTVEFDRCSDDESAALRELETEWAQFAGVDRRQCIAMATIGGFASYVELLTCLEMARDVVSANTNPRNPPANSGSRSTQPGRTGVADRH
jgi:hypothetical protein